MLTDQDWNRLVRYVTGECEPAEARETLRWINADTDLVRVADDLSRLHRAGMSVSRPWNVDAAWRKVMVLPSDAPTPRRLPAFSTIGRRMLPVAGLAASIMAVVAAGVVWSFVRTADHSPSAASPIPMHEIASQRGEVRKLRLSDGSQIILAPASRIRYASDFGTPGQPRDIYLEGRALFDVVHDDQRPFRVHTVHAVAEDIGTRFVVTSYEESGIDRVAIVEGIVALRDTRDTIILDRGDVGTASPEAGLHVSRDVELDADTAWTGGRLAFRDTPVRDVVLELARWYNIEIRLVDPTLGDRTLDGDVVDAPGDDGLADMARALGLRSERVGSVVWWSQQ